MCARAYVLLCATGPTNREPYYRNRERAVCSGVYAARVHPTSEIVKRTVNQVVQCDNGPPRCVVRVVCGSVERRQKQVKETSDGTAIIQVSPLVMKRRWQVVGVVCVRGVCVRV